MEEENIKVKKNTKRPDIREIVGRLLYFAVFVSNMICIVSFILWPQYYTGSYQLSGSEGAEAAIIGFGVAFAMWNVTYPFFVFGKKNRTLGLVIIVQQVVGLIGELFIQSGLNENQARLSSSITRFVLFDAGGLVLLVAGFCILYISRPRPQKSTK